MAQIEDINLPELGSAQLDLVNELKVKVNQILVVLRDAEILETP